MATSQQCNKRWQAVFRKLSPNRDEEIGLQTSDKIKLEDLQKYLRGEKSYTLEYDTGLPRHQLEYMLSKFKKADKNSDGYLTLKEWQDFLKCKSKFNNQPKNKVMGGVMGVVALSPTYTCSPPTLFIIGITALQVLFYLLSLFAPETMGILNPEDSSKWLLCSYFIYNPHKRHEVWRFVSYMFLHGSHSHIGLNMAMQLVVGIPLEMSQPGWIGSLRVLALYMAGVIFGSLGASCIQPKAYLVGASAGVYSLVLAHLATLILNWKEDGEMYKKRQTDSDVAPMNLNPWIRGFRLAFIVVFLCSDLGLTIYNIVIGENTETSVVGHAFGAAAGLFVGSFVLQNRKVEDWEKIYQIVTLSLYGLLLCLFIVWHSVGANFDWFPSEFSNNTQNLYCQVIIEA